MPTQLINLTQSHISREIARNGKVLHTNDLINTATRAISDHFECKRTIVFMRLTFSKLNNLFSFFLVGFSDWFFISSDLFYIKFLIQRAQDLPRQYACSATKKPKRYMRLSFRLILYFPLHCVARATRPLSRSPPKINSLRTGKSDQAASNVIR